MEDDDYLALIDLVERRLTDAGADELADPALYTRRDYETGERSMLPPDQRLVAMLEAFNRHMKARDIATFEVALKRINKNLHEGFVNGAIVEDGDDERSGEPVDLEQSPRFAEPRERLEVLIARLRDLRPSTPKDYE